MNITPVSIQILVPYSEIKINKKHKIKPFQLLLEQQLIMISQKIKKNNECSRIVSDSDSNTKEKSKTRKILCKPFQRSKFNLESQQNQKKKIFNLLQKSISNRANHFFSQPKEIYQNTQNLQNLKQPKHKQIHKNQPGKAIKKKQEIKNMKTQINLSSQNNLQVVLKKNVEKKKEQLQNIKTQTTTKKNIRTFQKMSKQKLKLEESNTLNSSSNMRLRLRGREIDKNNSHDSVATSTARKRNSRETQVKSAKKQIKSEKFSSHKKKEKNHEEDHKQVDMFDPNKYLLANSHINKPLRQNFIKDVLTQVPGRREEATTIFDFIIRSENGSSSPLCIHGNTGCGKTSMITKIVEFICQKFPNKMSTAYLNCMSMYNVSNVYSGILDKLFGFRQKKSERALNDLFLYSTSTDKKTLQTKFKKKNGESLINIQDLQKTKIIVLDQIDHFVKDQSFIYNLLEWIHMKDSKIILILISNVIDWSLKLQGKILSRMKFQTIVFKPYSFGAIQQIFHFKFPKAGQNFQKNAICFLCRKVASINSDIRLMEKMYEQAMENWQRHSQKKHKITIDQIQNSLFLSGGVNTTQLLKLYVPLLKVLHHVKPQTQITSDVCMKYFLDQKKTIKKVLESHQIFLLLCHIKDFGLIQITENLRNADATFQGLGIKINQQLHLLCPED